MTMTQHLSTQEERYLTAFQAFERDGFAADRPWVQSLRKVAISRFSELGFPVARRGNEEWKYTDVKPIAATLFQPLAPPAPVKLTREETQQFTISEASRSLLVFLDGRYAAHLSSVSALPPGVSAVSLAEAMAAQPDLVEQHLARHADFDTRAFTALNTAFLHDGAFVHIPDGALVEKPIHLLFLFSSQEPAIVTHPRVLVIAGKDSKATIIESYAALSDGRYFSNGVTELVVGAGAALRYYKLQRQSEEAFHITSTQVTLARNGSFSSVNVDLGGRLVRNNIDVLMGDEGSRCTLNGLYLVSGSQHVDNQVIIDHAKPYTTSRELYKGILGGKSRSVFHGSIVVRKNARKVDAQQTDKNLLLSDQAEADTKPAFWIYCDDVKCGHGAACGKLDENALFYLRSRGMDEQAARSMLVRGFASEVVNSIESEPVRTHVDQLVTAWLRRI